MISLRTRVFTVVWVDNNSPTDDQNPTLLRTSGTYVNDLMSILLLPFLVGLHDTSGSGDTQ